MTSTSLPRRALLLGAAGALVLGVLTARAPAAVAQAAPALLAVGTAAPAFSVPDQENHTRTLAEFRGRPVVLYFYPRDATPGCTTEACGFRDAWARYQAANAQVLGVSCDDVASHARFVAAQRLPFPLLADVGCQLAERYGVAHRGTFASRVTFLIDGAGVIRRVFPSVDPSVHANEVLEAIAALPRAPAAH